MKVSDSRYPHVSSFKDRHGNDRYRYRKSGVTISLRGEPGDECFDEGYRRASEGKHVPFRRGSTYSTLEGLAERRLSFLAHYASPALKRAKARALKQNVEFELTTEDFAKMMVAQQWKCAVTGVEFALRNFGSDRDNHAFRPSLDRVIPAQGYTSGNVRIVCEIANLAMNNWGEGPLIEMANAIVANRIG